MKYIAYNASSLDFVQFEANYESDIPQHFWNIGLVRSDDDFKEWSIWNVEESFQVKVISSYVME